MITRRSFFGVLFGFSCISEEQKEIERLRGGIRHLLNRWEMISADGKMPDARTSTSYNMLKDTLDG